jgi:hypothetical protein
MLSINVNAYCVFLASCVGRRLNLHGADRPCPRLGPPYNSLLLVWGFTDTFNACITVASVPTSGAEVIVCTRSGKAPLSGRQPIAHRVSGGKAP